MLLITAWYEGKLSEKADIALKTADSLTDTYKAKLKVKNEIKNMSKQDLDSLTVSDD